VDSFELDLNAEGPHPGKEGAANRVIRESNSDRSTWVLEKRIDPLENKHGMHKTNNLHKATEEAKENVVSAIESAKERAAETAAEIGRATRKRLRDAQGATEEALSEAASKAKSLRSEVGVYLHEQALNTIIAAVVAGLVMSLILLFLHSNRK
jgi:capsular polysaccharide biosynthesis protein